MFGTNMWRPWAAPNIEELHFRSRDWNCGWGRSPTDSAVMCLHVECGLQQGRCPRMYQMRSNAMKTCAVGAMLFGGTLGIAGEANAQFFAAGTGEVEAYNNLLVDGLSSTGSGPWTLRSLGANVNNPFYSVPGGNPVTQRGSALYTTRPGSLSTGLTGADLSTLGFDYEFDYSTPWYDSNATPVGFVGISSRISLNFFGDASGIYNLTPTRQLVIYFGSGTPVGLQSTGNLLDVNNTSITWQYLSRNGEPGYGWSTTDVGTKQAILNELAPRALEGFAIHLDGATGWQTQTMTVSNWTLNGNLIPAPGAIALLGTAGLMGRRRRN
jgi:hypothetical protein